MKKLFLIFIPLIIIYGCSNSTNPVNVIATYKPIYPQPGYNARNTSNPYCVDVKMLPVLNGTADWSYSFQGTYFSDGSEFCVDSKGNIYYVSQPLNIGGFYKFNSNGEVIWKRDSLIQWNFCSISLNAEEDRVYVVAFKNGTTDRLYCIDSTGKDVWSIPASSNSKPVIGKDGTLYTFIDNLTAVSKDGIIKWQNKSINGLAGKYQMAIDREDNIYVANRSVALLKIDKNGGIVWLFNTGFSVNGIVIDGYNNIYFNSGDYRLFCLDSQGKLKWIKSNANNYCTPVITSDNKILISSGIDIIAFDTSGTQIWKAKAFDDLSAEGLILDDFDNVYYLGDGYNQGIKVGSLTSTGQKRWEYTNSGLYITLPPPVLIPSGKFLFAPKRAVKIQALN